jgi:hypothetical protein
MCSKLLDVPPGVLKEDAEAVVAVAAKSDFLLWTTG